MTGLTVPPLAPDASTLSAALAYAGAGWYVLPVNPRDKKNPGGRVGNGWPSKSSRDAEQIVAWFAGTDDLLAVHLGRSGLLAFDVDYPDQLPEPLRYVVDDPVVPFQSTRTTEPGRGHYLFAVPEGRTLGNAKGELRGGWGEIRGRNGVIILAPSKHENAADGARYAWERTGSVPLLPPHLADLLPDSRTSSEDAATDAEVAAFLTANTAGTRPELLASKLRGYAKQLAEGESRHALACPFTVGLMREARCGFYSATDAVEAIRAVFIEATTSAKPGDRTAKTRTDNQARDEWAGILSWAIGQASAASDPELQQVRERIADKMPLRGAASTTSTGTASLPRLLEVLRRYQHLHDPGHILVTLAVAATRDLDDEPGWLLLVAAPSSGKTETVRLLDAAADARLNEVTAPGLLCWGKGKPPKPTGVLAELGPRGLLTFGDLSSLLATSDRGGRESYDEARRRAYCATCRREWTGTNALAVAARHTAAHRHLVDVAYEVTATYSPTAP